jgi:riboflavin kinase/FMN adenylyltransferase
MMVIAWEDLVSGNSKIRGPVSVTIGVFDGVHLGHRKLLVEILGEKSLPMVITFRRSPAAVTENESFLGHILSPRQKLERFEALRVAAVAVIDFSEQLSRLKGKAFISLLQENLTIDKITVGYDFRFGNNKDTDARALEEMCRGTDTRVRTIGPVLFGGAPVSSSRIRGAIREGALRDAGEMLAGNHVLDLRDVPRRLTNSRGMLRMIMWRSDIRQCLPKPGCYPVSCEAEAAAVSGLLTIREDSVELELPGNGEITEAKFQ